MRVVLLYTTNERDIKMGSVGVSFIFSVKKLITTFCFVVVFV